MHLRVLCLVLLLLLSVGCARAVDPAESEYLVRLARVLETSPPAPVSFQPQPFPPRRDLQLTVAAPTLDWGDFARLHRCDMGDLAGFRNSGLGRVMDALERLRYEQRWLAAAEQCLQAPEPPAETTRALLQRLIAEKRAMLPAVFANAVLAAQSMQRWQGAGHDSAAVSAAPYLRTLLDQAAALSQQHVSVEQVDVALQGLDDSRRVATAQRQWAAARALLEGAAGLLRRHGSSVCRNGSPTPRAQRLRRVFHQFYVDQEQPHIAAVVNGDAPWVQAFAQLPGTISESPSPQLMDWIARVLHAEDESSDWQRTRAAFVEHAQAWQTLGDQCGMDLFARGAG